MNDSAGFDPLTLGRRACSELAGVFAKLDPVQFEALCQEIRSANRIFCCGVGREGLMMEAIAMRLMHAGFRSFVVGEMVTPPIQPGDLFWASAGPGFFPTVGTLLRIAKEAGGRTIVISAQRDAASRMAADMVIHLPAQTMANVASGASLLTMGTHYEASLLLLGDLLVLRLLDLTNQKREDMYSRYTNLK